MSTLLATFTSTVDRAAHMTAADLLDAFAPHLGEGAVPAGSFEPVRAAASLLPPLSGMMLELHLGAASPSRARTDFSVRVTRPEARRIAEDQIAGEEVLAESAFAMPRWRPLVDFFTKWAGPEASLDGPLNTVENVWLEIDTGASHTMEHLPSIFFDIDRKGGLSTTERADAVRSIVQSLGYRPDPAALEHILRCADLAAPGLRLYYIGLMLPRAGEAVRVCLVGERASLVPSCLERIGWRGDRAALEAELPAYSEGVDKIILDVDLSARTHDPIGLELFRSPGAKWDGLFSLLEERGLCRSDEARAIQRWPGKTRLRATSPNERLAKIATIAGQDSRYLIRRINHVKLSFGPDGDVRAKAYLYLGWG